MASFITLPETIEKGITQLLAAGEKHSWSIRAERLHERYSQREKDKEGYLKDYPDALAYLALRVPSTYAQIYGALLQIHEVTPSWMPVSVLDIGSGPGTGVWAANTIYSSLTEATCIDMNTHLLSFGKEIAEVVGFEFPITWIEKDLRYGLGIEDEQYDLVIISSVLNELSEAKAEQLVRRALAHTSGVLLITEPGTEKGNNLIGSVAEKAKDEGYLIAPYINNSFVKADKYWIHFSQRFIRPTFERTLRQKMRASTEMASDWEEAKYSYVAISKFSSEVQYAARVIGKVTIQKGFLEVPVLTEKGIEKVKVLKRNKREYTLAKNLKWGEVVEGLL